MEESELKQTFIIPFEERVKDKHVFSLSYRERNNKGFKSLKAENCHFYYVNRNDNDSIFSLTEFDHCDGFHVHMENIKVIPLDMTAIDAPSWLFKLIKPFCKKMV